MIYHEQGPANVILLQGHGPDRDLPPYPGRCCCALHLEKDSPKLSYLTGLMGNINRGGGEAAVLYLRPKPYAVMECRGFPGGHDHRLRLLTK
jgi:hypothetical protein